MDAEPVRGEVWKPRQPGRRGAGGTMGLRFALVALGAVLGVALLARGNVLIGGIILVMAVLRAVMVLRWRSMRRARRDAFMTRRQPR